MPKDARLQDTRRKTRTRNFMDGARELVPFQAGTVSPSGPVREVRIRSESECRNDPAFTHSFTLHAPDGPEVHPCRASHPTECKPFRE